MGEVPRGNIPSRRWSRIFFLPTPKFPLAGALNPGPPILAHLDDRNKKRSKERSPNFFAICEPFHNRIWCRFNVGCRRSTGVEPQLS